jgi:uncharacterized protein YdcH (DUF465 family)
MERITMERITLELSEYNKLLDSRNQLQKENAELKALCVRCREVQVQNLEKEIVELKDKVSRRNMQIKDLETRLAWEKSESTSYAILLGKLGYNLKGNKI